jgi:hypothetical protein
MVNDQLPMVNEKPTMVFYIYSDINHSKGSHSCESRNPEKHWIPGQARNDKLSETYDVMYRSS